MNGNLGSRLAALEESTPGGYRTYDDQGRPVIQRDLSALRWMQWADGVLRGSDEAKKAMLRDQLSRSVRSEDGNRLFELLRAMDPIHYEGKALSGQQGDSIIV